MPQVTQIKAQKSSKGRPSSGRNQKRVNIYLDGKFGFGLPAETLVKAGLKVGQHLTQKQIDDLIFKNEFQKLLDRCLRLISFRPRSEREIQTYLKKVLLKRGTAVPLVGRNLVEDVLKKLKEMRVLDDEEFAKWWVEQRTTFRPRGKFGLTMELRQKGVDREIIKKVIEQVDELPLAKKIAQKKIGSYKNLPKRERHQKMSAFLARRGFSWEVIREILDSIL